MGWGWDYRDYPNLRSIVLTFGALIIFATAASSNPLWADKCSKALVTLPTEKQAKLVEIAKSLYSDKLAYHNFTHFLDVVGYAQRLVFKVQALGTDPDWEIIFYAILFHDAGYSEDHRALGFQTKEAYAEHLARKYLAEAGLSPDRLERVASCIRATDRHHAVQTLEEKIVRAADLAGLAEPYEKFREKAGALLHEFEFLYGRRLTQVEWKEMVVKNLSIYLKQHIQLTADYYSAAGTSDWHDRVNENLRRFLAEPLQ